MPVCGSEMLRITRSSLGSSGFRAPIASLRSGPRPASALPNSVRFAWMFSCVGTSKVLSNWSNSTGSGDAADSGSVEPAGKP